MDAALTGAKGSVCSPPLPHFPVPLYSVLRVYRLEKNEKPVHLYRLFALYLGEGAPSVPQEQRKALTRGFPEGNHSKEIRYGRRSI